MDSRNLFLDCVEPIIGVRDVNPVEVDTGLNLIKNYNKFLTYSALRTKIKAEEKLEEYIKREFETKPLIITVGGFGLIGRWAIPVVGYPVLLSWTKSKNDLISVYYLELNSLRKIYFDKFKTAPYLTAMLSNEL